MRALKYGLFIAAGIAGWVMLKHFAVKQSVSPWVDAVVFNAMEFIGLALGIGEQRAQLGGLTIGEGVRTGISIAAVYAVAGCVFFAVLYSAVGPGLLQYAQEPGTGERSASAVLAGACRLVHWRPAERPRFLAPALGADALEDAESVNQPVNQQGGTFALKR